MPDIENGFDFMTKENQLKHMEEFNKRKQEEINKIMAKDADDNPIAKQNKQEEDSFYKTLRANGIFQKSDMDFNDQFYIFPRNDPYNYVDGAREYIFITKVDLPLLDGKDSGSIANQVLQIPYFRMLWSSGQGYRKSVFSNLCKSMKLKDQTYTSPFINILSNRKTSNLDLPDITVDAVETNINAHGTRIFYPRSSIHSDEDIDFTLEFEDTQNLDIYHLFKAYDMYRRYKMEGILGPGVFIEEEFTKSFHQNPLPDKPSDSQDLASSLAFQSNLINNKAVRNYADFSASYPNWDTYVSYISNKILYDHFGLYKFLVANDGYTILFGYKIIGFYPSSIPRSTFSEIPQGGPLKLTVGFKVSGWVEDSDLAMISTEFNATVLDVLGYNLINSKSSPYYTGEDQFIPLYQIEDWDGGFQGVPQDGAALPFIRRAPVEVNGYRPYYLMWIKKQ